MKHRDGLKYRKELVKILETASLRGELQDFLEYLLSPAEFDEISLRIQILKQLLKGRAQRNIAKDFNVGLATVSRGQRALNEYQKIIAKIF